MERVYIALGANIGNPHAQLDDAVTRLRHHPHCHDVRVSRYVETDPVGCPPGSPRFLNAVLSMDTDLSSHAVLTLCRNIETQAGRDPDRVPMSNLPRVLDLDILLYGDNVISTNDLTVPHPRMHERAFVLVPLCELAPDLVHPVLKKSVRELCEMLKFPLVYDTN